MQVKDRKWGFIRRVLYCSKKSPEIDVFHCDCFHADVVREACSDGGSIDGQSYPAVQLIKNVFHMPKIFVAEGARLIVDSEVADALREIGVFSFRPAEIARAWYYPYEPRTLAFENDDAFPKTYDLDWSGFVEKYAVAPPQCELYELVLIDTRKVISRYPDMKLYDVPKSDGWFGSECLMSRSVLSDYGIVYNGSFVCTLVVYELLAPYLSRDYFAHETFPY